MTTPTQPNPNYDFSASNAYGQLNHFPENKNMTLLDYLDSRSILTGDYIMRQQQERMTRLFKQTLPGSYDDAPSEAPPEAQHGNSVINSLDDLERLVAILDKLREMSDISRDYRPPSPKGDYISQEQRLH